VSVNWLDLLPHLILAAGGFLVFCLGAFWKQRPEGSLFGSALITVFAAGVAILAHNPATVSLLKMVDVGGYGRFFAFLIILIAFLSLLFSNQYGKSRGFGGDEFFGLVLYATLGMMVVAQAIHWLVFFLGLEILSLALYVLIAIRRNDPSSNEAGVKYFIMGAVASAFLTFGIAMVYGATGRLDIAQSLAGGTQDGPLLLVGLSLVLIGIGFKISAVPFHLWTPDVYQGAPAPVTAFLATGSKVSLFAALLRMAYALSGNTSWPYFLFVFSILAVLTMAVGNISALAQTRVKRLLAYSSIAQMGYLLMTLLAVRGGGASAIMFYLGIYALMDLGAFGTLATLSDREDLDALEDCRGLAYSHPWRSLILAVSLGSLAGLPPTAGFMGKFMLFRAVLQAGYIALAVIGILTVIVSIYFYFKVIVALFMQPEERAIFIPKAGISARLAGALVLILILGLGIFPVPLFDVVERASSFLSLSP
jgi:NADH-quinone oxidoreductase subunit N